MDFLKRNRTITLLTLLAFLGVAFTGCLGDDGGNGGDGGTGGDGTGGDGTGGDGNDTGDGGSGNETGGNGDATDAITQLGTVRIGTLLPMTGSLEAYGPDMRAGTELAAAHIRAAGGQIELVHEDSRSDPNQAPSAMNNLVNEGVVGLVGAASSGVTGSILDLAVSNEIVVVTPASTSPALVTDRDNQGFFFRVPPSDALQGKVLAQLLWDEGEQSVNVLAVNNAYGVGLANQFETTFTELGGSVGEIIRFEEQGTTFSSQVQRAGEGDPDALVFIGYPTQGGQIVKEAYQRGIIGEDRKVYFSEGVKAESFVELVGQDENGNYIIAGMKGTTPQSAQSGATAAFVEAFEAQEGHAPNLFAAESYDATWAIYLGALAAGVASGEDVSENIIEPHNTPGTDYNGVENAQDLLVAVATGQDVNYQGAANDFDWGEDGDPTTGVYAVWQVTDEGTIETIEEGLEPE